MNILLNPTTMSNEKHEPGTGALVTADCFKCAHRRGRSAIDPDLVWCEKRRSVNYHKVRGEGCGMFREADKSELERNARLDYRKPPIEALA